MMVLLSLIGLAFVVGAWLYYLAMIPRERVPRRPIVHGVLMVVGSILTLAAVLLAIVTASDRLLVTSVLAVIAIGFAIYFYWLLRQAPLPADRLSFAVGDPLPRFNAIDASGRPFASALLDGRRFFLKFFRGHW